MAYKYNSLLKVGLDDTGNAAAVAGSNGQLIYNNAGAYAGASNTSVGATGDITLSLAGAASTPPLSFTGTWFTGGTSTTTKPQVLIEPTGTTSTAWSTSGTGLGVNAASGFAGNLLDLQVNGTVALRVQKSGFDTILREETQALIIQRTNGIVYFGASSEGNCHASLFNDGFILRDTSFFGISNNANPRLSIFSDTRLYRDAAGIFAQRNDTNAQTLRVYGTYAGSGADYVRAALSSTSTAVTLAAETAGTGADDITLNLTAAGTGTVKANSNLELADAKDIVVGTTTGTKIGTATTQKLGFYNATPVVQPTAVADITTTATSGSLPTPDGSVTIADATTPTVTELLEYCVELEAKLEAALGHLRTLGLIAT